MQQLYVLVSQHISVTGNYRVINGLCLFQIRCCKAFYAAKPVILDI